ncbi:MAG: hypothetical protein ACRD97_13015 [Nitrososphaeraceae archaeon]
MLRTQQEDGLDSSNPYNMFKYSIRNELTRKYYERRLKNDKETDSHAANRPAYFSACCFPSSNTTFPASSSIQDAVGAIQTYP